MALNTIDLNKLSLFPSAIILDVGCGVGRHSLLAYRDFPIQVYGIDLSFKDLLEASGRIPLMDSGRDQDKSKGKIIFTQADGYALPFKDNTFDVVICSEVLEHVEDYRGIITELVRVLKPDACLALSVPKFFPEKMCWLLNKSYPDIAGHIRIFKGIELPNAVKELGLVLIEKHSAHAFHSPYWWLKCLFLKQGDEFLPLKQYKKFMDWQLMNSPQWTNKIESIFNPLFGKSNVYYFLNQQN